MVGEVVKDVSYRGTHFFPLSCSLVWRDRRREVGKTNEKQFVYGQRSGL